jgi:transcriptional regulator with XRE-family HTH domain
MMMTDFGQWLSQELDQRGWSRSEAARRGGVSSSALNKVINGYARPGYRLCEALGHAFNMPTEDIMRRAGLLAPQLRRSPAAHTIDQRRVVYRTGALEDRLLRSFAALDPADQDRIIDLVERLLGELEPRIIGDETQPP